MNSGWVHPYQCTNEHNENGDCLDEHGMIVGWRELESAFYSFAPAHIPNQVQIMLTAFVPGHGMLTTRGSIIKGGRHGEAPLLDMDLDKLIELVQLETKMGVIAMKRRFDQR